VATLWLGSSFMLALWKMNQFAREGTLHSQRRVSNFHLSRGPTKRLLIHDKAIMKEPLALLLPWRELGRTGTQATTRCSYFTPRAHASRVKQRRRFPQYHCGKIREQPRPGFTIRTGTHCTAATPAGNLPRLICLCVFLFSYYRT